MNWVKRMSISEYCGSFLVCLSKSQLYQNFHYSVISAVWKYCYQSVMWIPPSVVSDVMVIQMYLISEVSNLLLKFECKGSFTPALAVAEGMSKDCQQPTITPDRTNEWRMLFAGHNCTECKGHGSHQGRKKYTRRSQGNSISPVYICVSR